MKSGFKTTEFLLTVAAMVIGGLLAFGIITPAEGEAIEAALPVVADAAEAVIAAVGALGAAWAAFGYSKSRGEVKAAEQDRFASEALNDTLDV